MKITTRRYPSEIGEIVTYKIVNSKGASVVLSSLGAGILEVNVPNKMGRIENVALGYANPADYLDDGPCMGKIPGRYANRIGAGKFSLDGKEYTLAVNNGPNHLHGGPTGFQNRLWNSCIIPDGVRFEYTSADGEEGYPGELKVTAEYRWTDRNKLKLTLTAVSTKDTIINLTNHCYWNLRGADAGNIFDHKLRINAWRWLPTDESLLPTGEIAPVEGTPMDFRKLKPIGRNVRANFPALVYGKGYDNCWVLDSEEAVVLKETVSGRKLTVRTDQPAVQVYTGNWLVGSPVNHSGHRYLDYDGVAIEAQNFPDAPNKSHFPSPVLKAGEKYSRFISFEFSTGS
ncbi:MAG: galactose mutarotase [Muribaculaceae bacterium]|nr:galactose mutarotase [Muribaculaceae bacterium]